MGDPYGEFFFLSLPPTLPLEPFRTSIAIAVHQFLLVLPVASSLLSLPSIDPLARLLLPCFPLLTATPLGQPVSATCLHIHHSSDG